MVQGDADFALRPSNLGEFKLSEVLPEILDSLPSLTLEERIAILSGIVTVTGHSQQTTAKEQDVFISWVIRLPVDSQKSDKYTLPKLFRDLLVIANAPMQTNRILVPTLNTLAILLEGVMAEEAVQYAELDLPDIFKTAQASISRSKIQMRLLAACRLLRALALATDVRVAGKAQSSLSETLDKYPAVSDPTSNISQEAECTTSCLRCYWETWTMRLCYPLCQRRIRHLEPELPFWHSRDYSANVVSDSSYRHDTRILL